uniref:Deoxyribose-phosphate aldolase n=1 Tax=Rhinopithecus roxellana TaxID=61622 RepID=A0A2K6RWB9_RHIRO
YEGHNKDLSWISKIQVNHPAVLRRAEQIQARRTVKKEWQALPQLPFVFIPPGCVML